MAWCPCAPFQDKAMTRPGWLALALAAGLACIAQAQAPPAPNPTAPGAPAPAPPPAAATAPAPAVMELPVDVQVVRFQVPEGVRLEVLAPTPEPVPTGDNRGAATVGLRVGVEYRLKLSNLPNRPGEELYPAVTVVGHL